MAKVGVLFNGVPMLTDALHHPGNTPGVPLVKESGAELDESCCCGVPYCCGRATPSEPTGPNPFPATLTLTLTNISNCDCIDGQTITLTWNATDAEWQGTGTERDGDCMADIAIWELSCSDDETLPVNSCRDFLLSMAGGLGSCVSVNDFANPGCACDPLFLEFTINATGIGCCNPIPGAGTILATITE